MFTLALVALTLTTIKALPTRWASAGNTATSERFASIPDAPITKTTLLGGVLLAGDHILEGDNDMVGFMYESKNCPHFETNVGSGRGSTRDNESLSCRRQVDENAVDSTDAGADTADAETGSVGDSVGTGSDIAPGAASEATGTSSVYRSNGDSSLMGSDSAVSATSDSPKSTAFNPTFGPAATESTKAVLPVVESTDSLIGSASDTVDSASTGSGPPPISTGSPSSPDAAELSATSRQQGHTETEETQKSCGGTCGESGTSHGCDKSRNKSAKSSGSHVSKSSNPGSTSISPAHPTADSDALASTTVSNCGSTGLAATNGTNGTNGIGTQSNITLLKTSPSDFVDRNATNCVDVAATATFAANDSSTRDFNPPPVSVSSDAVQPLIGSTSTPHIANTAEMPLKSETIAIQNTVSFESATEIPSMTPTALPDIGGAFLARRTTDVSYDTEATDGPFETNSEDDQAPGVTSDLSGSDGCEGDSAVSANDDAAEGASESDGASALTASDDSGDPVSTPTTTKDPSDV